MRRSLVIKKGPHTLSLFFHRFIVLFPCLFDKIYLIKITPSIFLWSGRIMGFVYAAFKIVYVLVLGCLVLSCFSILGSDARLLPQEEVEALQAISSKLENLNWAVTQSSCDTGEGFLNRVIDGNQIMSNVSCSCPSTVCHVTSIWLKGLNLSGILPSEFGSLTHLQELDLARNYINGSIPTSFVQIPLVKLTILGNRLSGSIPDHVGNMTLLEELVLEDNELSGSLPENLGNLSRLRRLLLSANNFTGTIPESYGNLKNLTDFRIDGSNMTGKIPEFIGNWTEITRLDLQGTSMDNPIPSTISLLTKMKELRISDLNGPFTGFPNLTGMMNMKELILRNCLINDTIPPYIGAMNNLKVLDLSFNKLTGSIPQTFQNLSSHIDYIFLTNNSLTGEVPSWTSSNKNKIDLSYNNFTGAMRSSCQMSTQNLVSSYLPSANEEVSWCLQKDLPCSGNAEYHSLFINCGGRRVEIDGNQYEEDLFSEGRSNFYSVGERWGYSSTGMFMGKEDVPNLAENTFGLNLSGASFYETARLSALSLKYYGLCLRKGSYNVKLHFAEIMYSDDRNFSSLGRRIFDVSVQGNLVLKDFNIAEKAGGVGKGYTYENTDVIVNGSTLEIHLYWAGKGTTAIPDRGVYGPLISAITVTPNFEVGTGGLSAGAIAGIVIASCVLVILVLVVLWIKGYICAKC